MSDQQTKSAEHHFENENVSVNVSKLPNSRVVLEIRVTPKATEAAYQTAIKKLGKEVSIPGFRKGKAPKEMILKQFSGSINNEFHEITYNTGFVEAIQLANLHPIKHGQNNLKTVHEVSKEKGAHFVIECEVKPEVPLIKPQELTIPSLPPLNVTEEMLEETIKYIASQHAEYTPIEDRGIEEGDYIDLDVYLTGEISQHILENRRIEVKKGAIPNFIFDKLLGLKTGETVEGMTEKGDNNEDIDFKSEPFSATVNSVLKINLPVMDEEFAKKLGVPSFEELKSKVKSNLEKDAEERERQAKYTALRHAILSHYSVDLPATILEAEKDALVANFLEQKKDEEFNQKEYEEVQKIAEHRAREILTLSLLLNRFAHEYQIKPTDEEVREQWMRQFQLMMMGSPEIKHQPDQEDFAREVNNLALNHKIKDTILEQVNWT